MNRFAEVILPLPLNATFTYLIPQGMEESVAVGSRVIVPFGIKKFHTAIVVGFPLNAPEGIEIKEISMLLDPKPIVRYPQIKLWEWIADYYLSTVGEVYRAALPAGLKIESETSVSLDPDFDNAENGNLTENEIKIIGLLGKETAMTLASLSKETGIRNISETINRLLECGAVIITEKLVEKYHSRKVKFVELAMPPNDAFSLIKGKERQETLLLAWLSLSGSAKDRGSQPPVDREALMQRAGDTLNSTLQTMIKKGIFRIVVKEVNRFDFTGVISGKLPLLSPPQSEALDSIHKSWHTHDVTLLHGVTSSGKTELYIHLIDYVLNQGKRAFYLVPEIALTTQLTDRLKAVFGERVLVYHSKFSDSERVDIWNRLLNSSDPLVVIGARSAVFLPFGQLGLVIVDEEHEASYKQADPAPRYNGRDVAIVLASFHGAKVLLGSATPSVETRYKAESGKFGFVELSTRYGDAQLPEIEVVDILKARNDKQFRSPFALSTIQKANNALERGEQVIFFQNRRGFAPIARCTACAWTPKCDYCDVSMTVHKSTRQLVCHYCGATKTVPTVCPACKEPKIEIYGYGTERIEDATGEVFAGRKILRMDFDTTRNKDGYQRIIEEFSQHKADILVGTQMVTKGLDFDGVSVVGVLNADTLINIPDFRSAERAFNMLEQVAGRAGRRSGNRGKVIIQTTSPGHPVIKHVCSHDYAGFYEQELQERRRYSYPPFTRIVNIYIKHRDYVVARDIARLFADRLRILLGSRVNGPDEPPVSRIQSLYIRRVMLKIEVSASMKKVKELLKSLLNELAGSDERFRRAVIYYDVDPV